VFVFHAFDALILFVVGDFDVNVVRHSIYESRFMSIMLVHRSSDEAHQRVRSSSPVRRGRGLLRRHLDASAALWNEINYQRRTNFEDPDGDVWEIDEYRGRYGGTLGASTVQQIERKNREAWRSFFALREKGEANGKPGFWGNQDEGRELRTYIRNTSYSVEWGEHSRLEILVGQDLKEEYGLGYGERLRLEVRGKPNWKEYDKQGRLERYYDDVSETFRAFQPVTIDNSRLAQPLADETAALDIGANNIGSSRLCVP